MYHSTEDLLCFGEHLLAYTCRECGIELDPGLGRLQMGLVLGGKGFRGELRVGGSFDGVRISSC